MKNKRIFFVATVEFSVNAFLINHLKILRNYFDITVIVNTSDAFFLKKQGLDVKVIPLKICRNISIFSDFYCLVRLIEIFIKGKPKVVHSITPKAGLLAMLASFIALVPIRIHTYTGQVWVTQHGIKRYVLKCFDQLISRLSTFSIVDSLSQQKFLIEQKVLTEGKSIVFGTGSVSGVDLNRFKPSRKIKTNVRSELLIPNSAFVFIFLGRLSRDKGVLDLAQAFAKIQNSKVFLLIVGQDEGNFVHKMKVIIAHKSSQVRFVEFTNKPENYLAASDVLCLPSYREGFGNVIIEAAATATPAIASDIYGISDAIINYQTGLLHTPKDVNSIFDAMQYFLENPGLVKKYGEAAMERVKVELNAKLMSKYWCDFYLQEVGRR